jgi:hypothetical protein
MIEFYYARNRLPSVIKSRITDEKRKQKETHVESDKESIEEKET